MKKRVLITISFSFSIRYIVRTGLLQKLREFVEPVIAITWQQDDLIEELRNDGFEVHLIPESVKEVKYTTVRHKLDYWFKNFKLKSPTKNIEPRYLERYLDFKTVVIRRAREYYNTFKFMFPFYVKKILRTESELLHTHTNFSDMLLLVDSLNIDAVFVVTPFHSQEDIFLRACEARDKKMITSILSFDNIVKRGWIPVKYHIFMVWNNKMRDELLRIYFESANEKNVHVVGAAQFDFYRKSEYIFSREEWLNIVGLPDANRKIILFAGGPVSLFPQEYQFLQHIDAAISSGEIKGNPIVLFRCHPIDKVERWKDAVKGSKNVFFDTSWTGNTKLTYANITNNDIAKLCSTLYHTDVHVNTCSTMTVDGSAFNKPQIGPAYDELTKPRKYDLKSMYYQEYFLPIMLTNGLAHAYSRKDLIDYVNDALVNPEKYIVKSKAILETIITYSDGKCTDRVVDVIKQSL